jgi:molybdopterin-synthase adenylyltransferase
MGIEGQERLRAGRALIVGAGGLGCPASLYLAASGLGRLTIADPDEVDLTNLQRQILYTRESVGRSKVAESRAALQRFNAEVNVVALQKKLGDSELRELAKDCDVVLDCTDNFATRHAVNRICVELGKPLVSGAAIRFDGQLAVFDLSGNRSPCYACVFPESGESEELRCAVMGVFAPLTGVIGTMQAMEAIKLVARVGRPASGRLLVFDAASTDWRSIRVAKDPGCAVCSQPSK